VLVCEHGARTQSGYPQVLRPRASGNQRAHQLPPRPVGSAFRHHVSSRELRPLLHRASVWQNRASSALNYSLVMGMVRIQSYQMILVLLRAPPHSDAAGDVMSNCLLCLPSVGQVEVTSLASWRARREWASVPLTTEVSGRRADLMGEPAEPDL
jgi:hypothetical protein